mmetsp:Transcript_66878/g.139375  ORF Transcript_66878/g.139375 Transcript_66878/m.139375 type:complete len:225 (-) Transcript_66878:1064-1738(-)
MQLTRRGVLVLGCVLHFGHIYQLRLRARDEGAHGPNRVACWAHGHGGPGILRHAIPLHDGGIECNLEERVQLSAQGSCSGKEELDVASQHGLKFAEKQRLPHSPSPSRLHRANGRLVREVEERFHNRTLCFDRAKHLVVNPRIYSWHPSHDRWFQRWNILGDQLSHVALEEADARASREHENLHVQLKTVSQRQVADVRCTIEESCCARVVAIVIRIRKETPRS